ncbi:uncharacterized protein DS421_14g462040 [Arachis hypogaea]|nr:uncharacterized protein DS421_14g462040 [Arachis hypogaea]
MREEGEALPSRPWLSPRVPVAAASEFVAVKQSAHRGEAVQATVKSPSMKLQPLYLWSPETAVGAATFLGLFIASCSVGATIPLLPPLL